MFWVATDGTRRAGAETNPSSHWEPRFRDKSLTAARDISPPSRFSIVWGGFGFFREGDGGEKTFQFCPGRIWMKVSCWICGETGKPFAATRDLENFTWGNVIFGQIYQVDLNF